MSGIHSRQTNKGELGRLRERSERPAPHYPEPPRHVVSPAGPTGLSAVLPPDQEDKPGVLGTYRVGGARYVMFDDGSVEAETPEGTFRYSSLDELQASLASGGGRLQDRR